MDTSDLIILLVFLLIGVFLLAGSVALVYHCYKTKQSNAEDRERLIDAEKNRSDQPAPSYSTQESSFISLAEMVRIEREKTLHNTQQSAFLYLQFYIRSSTNLNFKTVEQLPLIGNHKKRTWFLTIDTQKLKKLILIDSLPDKNSKNQVSFTALNGSAVTLNEIFVSLKHENVLGLDEFEVDTEKGRLLAIQDYSDEGSLRDLIQNTKPNYDYFTKMQQQVATPLCTKLIGYYGRQILMALIYLRKNSVGPVWRLHAGNIIMFKKKQLCKLTGFEEILMNLGSGKTPSLIDKEYDKLRKSYFIEAEDDAMKLKKCTNDYELRRVLEMFRFGWLIIEMFTGVIENKKLLPDASVFKAIENFSDQKSASDMLNILNFIFYNKQNFNENNPKLVNCYALPSLEDLLAQPFFTCSKNIDENSTDLSHKEHLEFLDYLNGKSQRVIEQSRKGSTAVTVGKKKRKSVNESVAYNRGNSVVVLGPSKPLTSPPPVFATVPAPPPFIAQPPGNNQQKSSVDRTDLLSDIRVGAKLKKTVTNDRSKPII